MNLTNEARKDILNFVLELISDISDKDYQTRVWIKAEGPECMDFGETVSHLFLEGDGILEHYQDFGLTNEQYHSLKSFSEKFEKFPGKYELPEFFIDTPEWDEITKMAKEVLKIFNYPPKK